MIPPTAGETQTSTSPTVSRILAASALQVAVAVTVAKWEGELDEASYRAKPVE